MRFRDDWGGEGAERVSRSERFYDGLSLLALAWPATGGMWLLGSTRTWGYAFGLVLSFLGSMLVLARPLVFPSTPRWRVPSGFWVFALLTAYVVAGVSGAAVPYAARWEALKWVCLLAAAFAWTQAGMRAHRWKWLLGVLLLVATLDSLYAIVQQVNGSPRVLWLARPAQYGLRASGTYLCPNHFANVLAMAFPVAVVLALLPEAGFPLRLMSLYFLGVSAPVLYWTQSRSGWMGAMAGLGTSALLLAWRRSRAGLLAALVALPLLAAAIGWTAWHTLPAVKARFGVVWEDPVKAGGVRLAMWRDAPAMFRDRPWRGFGGGSYVWVYPPYQAYVDEHLNYDYPHNEYIQILLEYGAFGGTLALAGLLAVAWGLARGVLRSRSREGAFLLAGAGGALAASLVHAVFDFNFHIFPNPHALVWMGGAAWGVWFAREQGRDIPEGRARRVRLGISAAGAAACGIGAWLALSGGMSYGWNLKAEMAREKMDYEKVERAYRKAIRWDGWNWKPHLGLGNLKATQAVWLRDPDPAAEKEIRKRLAEEAAGHFREAKARNSRDMEIEFGWARALNAMGDRDGALEHFRRAATYQHRHVFYREQLGVQLRQMGRDPEALDIFRKNVEDKVAGGVSALNIRSLERKLAKEAAAAASSPPAP
ncbi:MAG: O-antigen ligase family protein [Kiritimatiellia bacterium]